MKRAGAIGAHLMVILALGLVAYGISKSTFTYGENGVAEATRAVISNGRYAFCAPNVPSSDVGVLLPDLPSYEATREEKRRLGDQAIKAQEIQCMHAALIGRYVGNYYMAVVVSVVFAGVAAVALFLVGPKGWIAASPYLVNVLIVSGAIAAFYSGFPSMFRQADMVAAHKVQFLRYEELLDGMKSQIAEPSLVPRNCVNGSALVASRVHDTKFSVAEFIACTDDSLAALDLPFALDPSHVSDYSTIGGAKVRN